MNYDEIGRALAMPVGTVKSHLFRARQKLRERLMPAVREGA
jgi:DNA-directed RNA polymerase specialized sigma24 family protein